MYSTFIPCVLKWLYFRMHVRYSWITNMNDISPFNWYHAISSSSIRIQYTHILWMCESPSYTPIAMNVWTCAATRTQHKILYSIAHLHFITTKRIFDVWHLEIFIRDDVFNSSFQIQYSRKKRWFSWEWTLELSLFFNFNTCTSPILYELAHFCISRNSF